MKWGMVIDLTKCMRCHGCVAACRIEHFLPFSIAWVKLIAYEVEDKSVVDVTTYAVRCNQCKDAPCIDVCPTEATHRRDDGIVDINSDLCISWLTTFPIMPKQDLRRCGRRSIPIRWELLKNVTFAPKGSMKVWQRGWSPARTDRQLQLVSTPARPEL